MKWEELKINDTFTIEGEPFIKTGLTTYQSLPNGILGERYIDPLAEFLMKPMGENLSKEVNIEEKAIQENNMSQVEMPKSLESHQIDYKEGAWQEYTLQELGQWVHLLAKRATHRDNPEKRAKDLKDAQNYLDVMQAKLNALKG